MQSNVTEQTDLAWTNKTGQKQIAVWENSLQLMLQCNAENFKLKLKTIIIVLIVSFSPKAGF